MNNWTAGYVADIAYTYGYYTELNPLRTQLALLNAGLHTPDIGHACELGFGQGMSVAIHATASAVQWSGTDFNPSQAGFAQELAQAAGINAKLSDEAFEQFCQRSDLPDFDYIGLHGIWSWISDSNRAVITDFLRRKLKVGGVLYISYNTQPGWATMLPVRDLLTQHAEVMGVKGQGIVHRIKEALTFTDRLLATDPLFKKIHPTVTERIKKMGEQNPNYLAHEYFNRDWHPMSFAKMTEWLEPAKLSYACSAHFHDYIDALNVTDEQQQFLQEIPDAMFRETVRDFMCNTQFRRDYWIKGPRQVSPLARNEGLRSVRVVLLNAPAAIGLKATGSRGEANLNEGIYRPLIDALSDFKPRNLAQLQASLPSLNFAQVLQAVLVMVGKGDLGLAQDEALAQKLKRQTDKLNQQLMQKSRSSNDIGYLASPLTGGGITVGRFQQLFLLARQQGHKTPDDWAQFVWTVLQATGQRLMKDGQALNAPEDNLAELRRQAQEFADQRLPLLKSLLIA